jgi:hypothetical protein
LLSSIADAGRRLRVLPAKMVYPQEQVKTVHMVRDGVKAIRLQFAEGLRAAISRKIPSAPQTEIFEADLLTCRCAIRFPKSP